MSKRQKTRNQTNSSTCKLAAFTRYVPEPGSHVTGRARELFIAVRNEMADVMLEWWPSDGMYLDVFAYLLVEQENRQIAMANGHDPGGVHAAAWLERLDIVAAYQEDCGITSEALVRVMATPKGASNG